MDCSSIISRELRYVWRNFRIRTKMMLGFILVLAVFVVSITVTWSLMEGVSSENERIVSTTIPAQSLTIKLDESAYKLFLAMRSMQYVENGAAAAAVKESREAVQKHVDDIAAFYAANPTSVAMANITDNVIPKLKEYFKTIDNTIALIARKKETDGSLSLTGNAMSESINTFISNLRAYLEREDPGSDPALYRRYVGAFLKANELSLKILDARRMLLHFSDARDLENAKTILPVLGDIYKNLEAFAASLTVEQNRELMAKLLDSSSKYVESANAYIAAIEELGKAEEVRNAARELVNAEITKALGISEHQVIARSGSGVENIKRAMNILFVSAVISILLGLAVAFFISRSIANPLALIVKLAKRAGDGDLTVKKEEFRYRDKDELGMLVDTMSLMIGSQENAMQQVISVSGSLGESASNLSAISEKTNASMVEIKASIDQVASLSESNGASLQECNAGVGEMRAGADTVAQSATDSAAFISQTTTTSNKAIQTVNKVIDGMRGVDANARAAQDKMKQLADSVANVSSFVTVITGIADQTNLLALNAAIEAARAGEVGRGFAVVAEEVRKLAEESARAAQSVNGIIGELQNGAQDSIKATTEAGRRLADILTQAEQAQGELNSALNEMNKANDSIQNIAAVAQEQAASSKEVAFAIDRATKSTMEMVETVSSIRRASEETARASQSVAEHSEAMNGHASNLTDVLSHFKLSAVEQTRTAPTQKSKPKALR